MDYARNYLNTTSLAERIRQSATKGDTVKAGGGLGAKEELRQARQSGAVDFSSIRAQYMNDIQDMFSSFEPAYSEPEVTAETGGMSEIPADFSLSEFIGGGEVDLSGYSEEAAERIEGKLIEKGLPEHVAKGFVYNFADESGLNPVINERNPTVPGSRGGFGLYQLTGPRRVQYENYAKARGVNLSDPMEQEDAQIDFMLMELETTENKAWQKIQEAPDAGSAAAMIVTYFLRPAEEHRISRVNKYTGT